MEKNHESIMTWPEVSIITPIYNSELFIQETINSVLNQTFSNWEMICVDDCSTDKSESLIRKNIKTNSRIKYYKLEKNQGAAKARNKAIELARGRYIAFLDSDDLWKPNKLNLQIQFMKEHDLAMSHTPYESIDENGKLIHSNINTNKITVSYKEMLIKNHIGCLTVIYDAHKIGKVFMPDIRKRQDYAFWLKIMRMGHTSTKLNTILATYRIRKNSISSKKFKLIAYQWNVFRNIENLNFAESIYYTGRWMINGFLKYYFK